jgi:hypothetical protein
LLIGHDKILLVNILEWSLVGLLVRALFLRSSNL